MFWLNDDYNKETKNYKIEKKMKRRRNRIIWTNEEVKSKKIKRNIFIIINNKSKYVSKNILLLNKIKLTANFKKRIMNINK